MKRPWTVDLANLADHAIPLGAAINRALWRHSPWHREYTQWQNALEWQHLAFELERQIELCGDRLATDLSFAAPLGTAIVESLDRMFYDLRVRPVYFRLAEWRRTRTDPTSYPDIINRAAHVVGRNFADQVEAAVKEAMLGDAAEAETPRQRAGIILRGGHRSA